MQIYHVYLLGYTWVYSQGKRQVIFLYRGFGHHLQIRVSPRNKFNLRDVHLNPHAKCRSSKFNLKQFKKKKNGGHLKHGNTLAGIF